MSDIATEGTIKRAVAYIRVSTKEQAERRQSLKTQEESIVRYAERNNIQLVKKFVDAGESAKTADRAELINCIKYCGTNKGKVDHLIVFKIDRLARNAIDHQTIIAGLAKFGVTLKSATEALDDTASGKLMGTILSGFAEFDNDIRTERVRTGMISRTRDGYWVWKAPVGYRSIQDEGKRPILVPYKDEAEIVKFIFNEFAKGIYKQTEVLEQLKRFDLIASGTLVISTQRLNKILTNKVYIGVIETIMIPEPVRGKHEPLIDDDTFYRCQKLLGKDSTRISTRSKVREDFPLKGVLRCPDCGGKLTASWCSGKSKKYPYYHCSHCKQSVNIPAEAMQKSFETLLDSLKPQASALKLFKKVFMATWQNRFTESKTAVAVAEKKLQELELSRKRLINTFAVEGKLNEEDFEYANMDIKAKIDVQNSIIGDLKFETYDYETALNYGSAIIGNTLQYWRQADPAQKQKFQLLIFPQGIACDKNGIVGTPVLSPLYAILAASTASESNLVVLMLENWNTLLESLQTLYSVFEHKEPAYCITYH